MLDSAVSQRLKRQGRLMMVLAFVGFFGNQFASLFEAIRWFRMKDILFDVLILCLFWGLLTAGSALTTLARELSKEKE